RYPAPSSRSGGGMREVYLEGTALFAVAHDSIHPLVVRTANAVTEDIGTEFMVTAYPETHATEVVVTEGTVSFGGTKSTSAARTVLGRGQAALVGAHDGDVPVVHDVDPSEYGKWVQGKLAFRSTPLRDAVVELQRWYDADIRIGDSSIADRPLTASFAAESLPEALSVITTVMRIHAVRRGRVITLYARE